MQRGQKRLSKQIQSNIHNWKDIALNGRKIIYLRKTRRNVISLQSNFNMIPMLLVSKFSAKLLVKDSLYRPK